MPLHSFPSLQERPAVVFACITPCTGSHESSVQTFPSSITGGELATQLPEPSHRLTPLHTLPSSQLIPAETGVCVTPPDGSQASAVHGFSSSKSGALPAVQAPAPSHTLTPLQTFPSSQLSPLAIGSFETPRISSQLSTVQGFSSS